MKGEDALQASCVEWCRLQYPGVVLMAIPNGGRRNLLEAVRMKRTGTLAGAPDLLLARPNAHHHALFVELKMEKGRVTDRQAQVQTSLMLQGYRVEVVRSFDEFQKVVKGYLSNVLV